MGPMNFDIMFTQLKPALCSYANRFINDAQCAQDIVTDVFLRYWQRESDFENMQSVKFFLFTCTRNACLNHLKKENSQARYKESICRHLSNYTENDGFYNFIKKEVLKGLHESVCKLPPRCRKVIELCFLQGLDCNQIAILLKVSIHTVRNQKARGLFLIKTKSIQMLC
jgi:RNA polymerase sigma-70 factor (family 1)